MSRESINRLLDQLGPILMRFDDSIGSVEPEERLKIIEAAKRWPQGRTARTHYVTLESLIKCLTKLNQ